MKIKGLLALSAFSFILLGLPAVASAQWGGNGGYGNGGYGNGGYYGNGNLRSVVRNLKNKAERFEDAVDRWDDRRDNRRGGWGNWGGNVNYGGSLEQLTDQFTNATKRLEDRYGNGRNMNNSADEARRVLDLAAAIDRQIYNSGSRRGNLQGQWNSIRQDLNAIANAYGYYNNNGYPNRNNRRNRGNNFPFPY
jgi:hypothetical protein